MCTFRTGTVHEQHKSAIVSLGSDKGQSTYVGVDCVTTLWRSEYRSYQYN